MKTKYVCLKKYGFKTGYRCVSADHVPNNRLGTGEYECDEQDKKLLSAWPGEIIFQNGDSTPVPVGFIPRSWDDPKIKELAEAGFASTIGQWVSFRPQLSTPPPHVAEFYRQVGLTMQDGAICYRRDFITKRAKYDGRTLLWPQEGFQVTDYFDRPPEITIHERP